MTHVSISAYNDADLVGPCLQSVRDVLPDASITVVDGKYETFRPDAEPNSTDDTGAVARSYEATYDPAGPFERERDKHVYRVESAPDELCLFMDADERLLQFNHDALQPETAYSPRLYNALVYGPVSVYWPRIHRPEWIKSINRWDAYLYSVPHERTDAVTIIHRHDLRDRDYREAKYQRFEREDRDGRYDDYMDEYLNDDWGVDFDSCPACGEQSLTRSQYTDYGEAFSRVTACVNGECYADVETYAIDTWHYLPGDWERGVVKNPERLRLELIDAGCEFVRPHTPTYMQRNMRPVIGQWVREEFHDAEDTVFSGP